MNHYISSHQYVKDSYFDNIQYKPDPKHIEYLKKNSDLDDRLAFHVASLFVRDPIPTYSNEFEGTNDEETTANFENL